MNLYTALLVRCCLLVEKLEEGLVVVCALQDGGLLFRGAQFCAPVLYDS